MHKFNSAKHRTLYNVYHRIMTMHNAGKGVVCDRWKGNFDAFANWALYAGYMKGVVLKKRNDDEEFSPSNCYWVSREEIQKNSGPIVFIEYRGMTKTIGVWAKNLGLPYNVARQRYDDGLKPEEIFRADSAAKEVKIAYANFTPVEAYEKLANAIVIGAADDYRAVLKINKRYPDREERVRRSAEEKFFYSKMYETLTSVPPGIIIEGLKKEVWGS